jgi:hypothetical protein
MNLKNISLFFIFIFSTFVVLNWNKVGDGQWGIPISFLMILAILLAYLVFWFVGNFYYLKKYDKPDKKTVRWLLNIPAIFLGLSMVAWILSSHPGHAAFTLQVVNEIDEPIKGAAIVIWQRSRDEEITDAHGEVFWWGRCCESPKYHIHIDGYEPVGDSVSLKGPRPGIWPFRRLQPWNPTITIVLKRESHHDS